ncbi:MAG: hypothetical protein ACD_30C00047G0004 [uncultured bacterium]|uniref:Uncharacterized protein n=2 Tax=Candidatus Daviesiibacteriota TaxID=1752718 RepID=A0A0G0EUZ9_9BACT|nr:MAG: hypothetical protein ACD_30C00047G0004 [uncultured bacterium]KKQ10728.1 MAG: hypothetical protein US19_C0001G0066 [Candidatus Daviesbacteria bacterium GW2011_GWB1_36_5]KKQ15839.1 MAG: hypothetical protein US28_C0009G0018 [Candidatus Daviesbacteria bacterium GW2011_GWA1_36_8]
MEIILLVLFIITGIILALIQIYLQTKRHPHPMTKKEKDEFMFNNIILLRR